ncbi:motility associated factor glycosyltransferase family protein [Bacillus carboniphilus]|uniref:Motility associated factor glycosyltransferase family protein n=1 Tax=Bacillus carboniphilus TaxID=86663 RepID=A0ABN0VW14_9BACI
MSFAQKNISALLSKPYYSEQVINRINEKGNKQLNNDLIFEVESYLKLDSDHKLSENDFNSHINIILFGFFNIELVKNLLSKMSNFSTLTIFEKDIDILLYTFGNKDVSQILEDTRVVLLTGQKSEVRSYINTRVSTRDYSYNLPRIKMISSKYMEITNEEYINEIFHYLINQTKYIASTLGNDINDMLEGFDHSIENWPNLLKSIGVNDLKDKYKGIPAVIVSAGPSLDKNIQYLKDVYGKALILTVDTTLKKVLNLGIVPDSVSTIERPKNMYSIFYEDVDIPKETVFIGPSVVTKKIIDEFDRFIFTGRRGEPTVRAIANALEYESLEIGMSCAHIPFAFANWVGADPIIFIGQDLAFSKEGHTHFGEASDITKDGAKKQELIKVEGNDGESLFTNKFYYQFLIWFQNQIAQNNDKTFINATEGGAKIEGTKSMRFQDAIDLYCLKKVEHLSGTFDSVQSYNKPHKNDKGTQVKDFLEKLIEDSDFISKEAIKYKEWLLNCEIQNHENLRVFFEMRRELDLSLSNNYILNFLAQTITLKYNRSFNSYPVNMSNTEWKKLTSEGVRYYSLIEQVCKALEKRFIKYLSYIESIQ